uniref:Uncharacterized protein n=1 Tax=Sphaerodactylus townsendi TaxID=933632 RepID=A0ACB8FK15_9SAUR
MMYLSGIVTVFLVVVSVVWIPILQNSNSGQLYIYIQSVTSYLAPPVTAVFLLAVFWKRANEQGAFWGLMVGMVVGVTRMALDFAHPKPRCGTPDDRPFLVKDVHYLHFAALLCLVSAVVVVGISLLTGPPTKSQIENMTWWTLRSERCPSSPSPSAPESLPKNGFSRTAEEESREGQTWSPPVVKSEIPAGKTFEDRAPSLFWSRVCSVNAILLLCVNVFFYAYFA